MNLNREDAMSAKLNAKQAEDGNLHRDNAAELVMRCVQFTINSILRVCLRARHIFAVK